MSTVVRLQLSKIHQPVKLQTSLISSSYRQVSWPKIRELLSKSKLKVKCRQKLIILRVHHNTCSWKVTYIFDQQFFR